MIALNVQKPEKASTATGLYEVHSIWKTIQGEGPLTGMKSTFVRLAGCNLQCQGCDTDYTSKRQYATSVQIEQEIESLLSMHEMENYATPHMWRSVAHGVPTFKLGRPVVVLTGGEPFRQNIYALCLYLSKHYAVQIETNGTMMNENAICEDVLIVCSPKTSVVHRNLLDRVDYFKYVIEHGKVDPNDGLPLSVLGGNVRPARPPARFAPYNVYVQPMDCQDPVQNALNMQAATETCLRYGYRLSVQLHKLANVE